MNTYKLYEVKYIKGMLMYDLVSQELANNIIEAEHLFETKSSMMIGFEYVITISK